MLARVVPILLATVILSLAFDCDLGAADVLFVLKATYTLDRDDFDSMRSFLISFVDSLDLGRAPEVWMYLLCLQISTIFTTLFFLLFLSKRSTVIWSILQIKMVVNKHKKWLYNF